MTEYLVDLGRLPQLGEEQTRELIEKAQGGCLECRNKVVEGHLRLTTKLAKQFTYLGQLEDLVAEGNLGLIHAVRKFDLTKKTKEGTFIRFSTYASLWIIQSMRRMLSVQPGPSQVRVPDNLRRMVLNGMTPSEDMNVGPKGRTLKSRLIAAISALGPCVQVEPHLGYDPVDERGKDEVHEGLDLVGALKIIRESTSLTLREQEILDMTVMQGVILKVVGTKFGITKERVRQLRDKALKKIRTEMEETTCLGKDEAQNTP